MPAQAKTSDEAIVQAARKLVSELGVDALSMQLVADSVGVRPPSLYKRFPNRDALLDAVARQWLEELTARLVRAGKGLSGAAALAAIAKSYRDIAKRAPKLYKLLYTSRGEADDLVAARAQAVAPLLEALAPLVAAEQRLPAARMLTAFLHGYVSMEIEGAFKLGGDVTAAFDFGLNKLIAALD